MPVRDINLCLIGQKFMGRTHSNAWLKVDKFFTHLPARPIRHTVVERDAADLDIFQNRWQSLCRGQSDNVPHARGG